MAELGYHPGSPDSSTFPLNRIRMCRFPVAVTGTISAVWCYVGDRFATRDLRTAIYSDDGGAPAKADVKLAECSAAASVTAGNTWYETTGYSLAFSPGTYPYLWLAAWGEDNNFEGKYTTTGDFADQIWAEEIDTPETFPTWPADATAQWGGHIQGKFMIYAVYTASGGGGGATGGGPLTGQLLVKSPLIRGGRLVGY